MSAKAFPPPLILGGTVAPSVFLKLSRSADRTLLQAGLGDPIVGISQVGPKGFQLISGSLGSAGVAGDEIEWFMDGEPTLLLAGTGGWLKGDWLKSDANGAGIPGAVGVENIGARAVEDATAGSYGKVLPIVRDAPGASGGAGPVRTVTAAHAQTAGSGGVVTIMSLVTSGTVTLPPISTLAPGWSTTIVSGLATTSGSGTLVAINAADVATTYVYGGGFAGPYTAGKGALNTQATSKAGDSITLRFDGTNFLVTSICGTWAKQP